MGWDPTRSFIRPAFSDVVTPIPLSNSSGAFFDFTQTDFNALADFSTDWRTLFLAWPFEYLTTATRRS